MGQPSEQYLRPMHRWRYLIRDVILGVLGGLTGFVIWVTFFPPVPVCVAPGLCEWLVVCILLGGRLAIQVIYQGWERRELTRLAATQFLPAELEPLILPPGRAAYDARKAAQASADATARADNRSPPNP